MIALECVRLRPARTLVLTEHLYRRALQIPQSKSSPLLFGRELSCSRLRALEMLWAMGPSKVGGRGRTNYNLGDWRPCHRRDAALRIGELRERSVHIGWHPGTWSTWASRWEAGCRTRHAVLGSRTIPPEDRLGMFVLMV